MQQVELKRQAEISKRMAIIGVRPRPPFHEALQSKTTAGKQASFSCSGRQDKRRGHGNVKKDSDLAPDSSGNKLE
eukprot:134776-Hanusia_phi.AAC.1